MRQSQGKGPNMGAQHKRRGKRGKEARQKRAAAKEAQS